MGKPAEARQIFVLNVLSGLNAIIALNSIRDIVWGSFVRILLFVPVALVLVLALGLLRALKCRPNRDDQYWLSHHC